MSLEEEINKSLTILTNCVSLVLGHHLIWQMICFIKQLLYPFSIISNRMFELLPQNFKSNYTVYNLKFKI